MIDATTRDTMTRTQLVSYHLRLLALNLDPETGHLTKLAEEIEVHPTTLSGWISQGYVPYFQWKKLRKRFGRKMVPLDDLCPEEFRSN